MAYWYWILAHSVLLLLLLAIAIFEHVNTASLSLPLSPALTIFTILLPLFALANAVYHPRLVNSTDPSTITRPNLLPTTLQILQLLQFTLTTILATLLSTAGLVPSPTQTCLLSTRWQRLWSAHDGDAIRAIQDALGCCGYNSVKDRSWPFPRGGSRVDCAAQFGRTAACAGPWMEALRRGSGAGFAVVVGVGVLQFVDLLVSRWLHSRQGSTWSTGFKRDRDRTRPLLEGNEVERRDDDDDDNDDDYNMAEDTTGGEGDQGGRRRRADGYGGTGMRIEPDHHDHWGTGGGSV